MPAAKSNKTLRSLSALLLTILICIALNLLGTKLNSLLGLPFYLDNIGTILSAAVGGYIPCITVGFLTNILNGLSDPSSTYYCIISVLIAVAAVVFHKKKMLTHFPHVLAAVLTFAFIGGVAGGTLTWLINGMSFGEGFAVDMAASIDSAVPVGYFTSNLISCFAIDFADKAISTTIALLIFKLLPRKTTRFFSRQSWYLINDTESSRKSCRSRFTMSIKVGLLVSVSITLIGASAIGVSIVQYHESVISEFTDMGVQTDEIISDLLNEDVVDDLIANGRSAKDYNEIANVLNNVRKTSPEIKFLYAYRVTEEGSIVVFDMDTPDDKGRNPGELIEHDDTIAKYLDLFLKGEQIPPDATNDEYGWLLSVYEPIRNSKGDLLCYAITDLSMERLRSDEIAFLARLISLFVGLLFLIRAYAMWMAQKFVVKPINTMAEVAGRFNYDTARSREESLKLVSELDIHSGDEIENLYDIYRKTTVDMISYINEVIKKSNQVANLQSGLILVMADMVESRDKCTGDHVKNTAEYVSIILNRMKIDGIYADQLTDEFIYDVVHSAPLHDVGKIKVPDAILDKPGKLTDEEFEIMKNHTVAGKEIIDSVISTVAEESDYLYEARNLALSHHEKWNGSGYPNGLKGEEIPLSARVMAVADVFDALVSRRSYKAPFTLERSMEIIAEGAGSHFDPLVVQAFLESEDQVRSVAMM